MTILQGAWGDGLHDERGDMQRYTATYLRHRRTVDGVSPSTLKDLRSRLSSFEPGVPVADVTRRHVVSWLDSLEGLSPASRRAYLSAVRTFFTWCEDEGVVTKNPCRGIKGPKQVLGPPKRLHADEVAALIGVARSDLRTLTIVLFMLQEGLRRGEVARMQVTDLDPAERSLRVRGKGGGGLVTAVLPVSDESWEVMARYHASIGVRRWGPVIRSKVNPSAGVTPGRVSELVTDAMEAAGIRMPGDSTRTAHSCRHTACHDLLAMTNDVRLVQKAMRHATVATTEQYLRGTSDDLRPVMGGRSYLSAVA